MGKSGLAVVFAMVPGAGMAHAVMPPLEVPDLAAADIVLAKDVTGYEVLSDTDGTALVKVQVDQVVNGSKMSEMDFVWNAGMAKARAMQD